MMRYTTVNASGMLRVVTAAAGTLGVAAGSAAVVANDACGNSGAGGATGCAGDARGSVDALDTRACGAAS